MRNFAYLLMAAFMMLFLTSCMLMDPYSRGEKLYFNGEYDAAEEAINMAFDNHESNAKAYYLLGRIHEAQGRLEEAIQDYKKAYKIDPEYQGLAFALGRSMLQDGIVKDSIIYLTRAISLEGESADRLFWLGRAYEKNGEPSKASELYKKALSLSPGSVEILDRLENVNVNEKDREDALMLTIQAVQRDMPQGADKYFLLGDLYFRHNYLSEAVDNLASCTSADSSKIEAFLELAYCYEKMNQMDDALKILKSGISANPGAAGLYDELTNVYLILDKRSEALMAYQKYLELSGKPPLTESQERRFGVKPVKLN